MRLLRDAFPEEAIIMSNNYDMAYFTREQSIVGKGDLMKPFYLRREPPGLPPRYPEEEAKRAKMRRDAFNLVDEAKKARAREELRRRPRRKPAPAGKVGTPVEIPTPGDGERCR